MSWKYDFLVYTIGVFFLFVYSCEKSSSKQKHIETDKSQTNLPEKICGMKLMDVHDVSLNYTKDQISIVLTKCTGSFILDNRGSEKPRTCSFFVSGPCVSMKNIFSRYGDRDKDRIKKSDSGEHGVRVDYTVPEKSYGLISIEPTVAAPKDSFSFGVGPLSFSLSGLALLRKDKQNTVIRSLAPSGSLEIFNPACRSQSFSLLLENFSDSLSRIDHSGLTELKIIKKAKLSYLLKGRIPGKARATINIVQRPVSRPWSFAFGGDVKDDIDIFLQLLEQLMLEQTPLFVLEAGDYTRNSLPDELHQYLERTSWLPIPVYYVKGNHEIRVQGEKHYPRLFGPARYSFSFDNVLFVILDSTDYGTKGQEVGFRLGSKQLHWLEKVLKSKPDANYSFITLHTPPSPLHGASLRSSYPSNMMPSEARALMDLAKKYSATYVLSGHAHLYARKKINGTIYLTSGAGGAKLHTYNKVDGFKIDTKKHLMVFQISNSGIKEKRVFLPREPKQ